eukprot:Nitzschia sp. Nitz4//scaffold219_size35776//6829//7950//NITZ4_007819-RA/size35776-processed-gene-0.3-mRNA-1//1//CDS//3329542305//3790//frame0
MPVMKAEEWYAKGERVLYDPVKKRIVSKESSSSVHVWHRVVAPHEVSSTSRWLTMMPGVPDGSYCFSKIDSLLQTSPRLYVEYVGLGGSDKPSDYKHSVVDRANHIEAHWRAQKIRRTVLVSQSCSSMVMMELLQRQRERLALGLPVRTRIEHVLSMSGAYFSHTHKPHPLQTPLIKHTVGKAALKAAQHSDCVMDQIISGTFAKDYDLPKEEIREIGSCIRRDRGTNFFTGSASGYLDEHKKNADRWNLVNVYNLTRRQGISFMIVGGNQDMFQSKAFDLAKEHLSGKRDIHFQTIPGGFHLPLEEPQRVAELVDGVAMAPPFDDELVWGVSKRSSLVSSDSTVSTESSSYAPSSSAGWADADYPDSTEFGW